MCIRTNISKLGKARHYTLTDSIRLILPNAQPSFYAIRSSKFHCDVSTPTSHSFSQQTPESKAKTDRGR